MKLVPLGFVQVSVTADSESLPNIPKDASFAYIQAQDDPVRWKDDGTDAAADEGHRMFDGDDLFFTADLHKFRFTLESGAPVLSISYYKQLSLKT